MHPTAGWCDGVPYSIPRARAGRERRALPVLFVLALLGGVTGVLPGTVAAPTCSPGWELKAQVDNSFEYVGSPTLSASWSGYVQEWQELDADCNVLRIWLGFAGPTPANQYGDEGGTVQLVGSVIGLAYSIQYPTPYNLYSEAPINAYGNATAFGPGANFVVWYAHIHVDINARGAEEYYIGTEAPQPTPIVVVASVFAFFELPLSLRGQTVYAQIHVYPDLCQCVATPIMIS